MGCSKLGIDISISTPVGFEPLDWIMEIARRESNKNDSSILVTPNPKEAIANADVVVTDTHVSIGKENEIENREKLFFPKYQE